MCGLDICSHPRARLDPVSGSEPKPGDAWFISFYFPCYYVFFFKIVATRIPRLTRRADPNWSPVYSDVFNYLIKTFSLLFPFRFSISRKHSQMVGAQTFTFHQMQLR